MYTPLETCVLVPKQQLDETNSFSQVNSSDGSQHHQLPKPGEMWGCTMRNAFESLLFEAPFTLKGFMCCEVEERFAMGFKTPRPSGTVHIKGLYE